MYPFSSFAALTSDIKHSIGHAVVHENRFRDARGLPTNAKNLQLRGQRFADVIMRLLVSLTSSRDGR